MRTPTIHLNGTSKGELAVQIRTAHRAVENAMEKLSGAWPNARDYYPQGEGAFTEAQFEWNARMVKLREVRDDLAAIREAIEDAR